MLKTVRCLVFPTIRPEIATRHGFCHMPEVEHEDFVPRNISPVIVIHTSFHQRYALSFPRPGYLLETLQMDGCDCKSLSAEGWW